jgi:hypothetical protein
MLLILPAGSYVTLLPLRLVQVNVLSHPNRLRQFSILPCPYSYKLNSAFCLTPTRQK